MSRNLNHAVRHADTRGVAVRRTTACLLIIVLFLAACRPEETDRTSQRAVPMGTWVAGLCTAFGRFGNDLGLTRDGNGLPVDALTDSTIDRIVQALRRLQSDVEGLGIPDVDGGAALASDVVAGVRRSLAAFEQARELRDSSDERIFDGDYPALAYPFALLFFLSATGMPGDAAVYLDDPVRDGIVARLSYLLERRADVASVRFESKAEACRRFKKLFADEEALVENVDCNMLPASLRVVLTPGSSGTSLHDALIHQNGVDKVDVQHASDIFTQGDPLEVLTQGDLLGLDPVRAEVPRNTECTSLGVSPVWRVWLRLGRSTG